MNVYLRAREFVGGKGEEGKEGGGEKESERAREREMREGGRGRESARASERDRASKCASMLSSARAMVREREERGGRER